MAGAVAMSVMPCAAANRTTRRIGERMLKVTIRASSEEASGGRDFLADGKTWTDTVRGAFGAPAISATHLRAYH